MFQSSKRFAGRGGSSVIGMALGAAPYVAAYRFSYAGGWGSRFAAPATTPGYDSEARGIAWGTDHTKLLLAGVTSTSLQVYNWTSAGFGSRNTSTSFTDANSVKMSKDGNYALVSGQSGMAEYNYSSASGIVSQRSLVSLANPCRQSAYILDDNFVAMGFLAISFIGSAISFRILSRGSSPSIISTSSDVGTPKNFSMSPVEHSSTRMLAIATENGFLRLYPISLSGVLGTAVSSTVGTGVNYALFDPYGRLIVGFSTGLKIYTLDSSGNQTLLDTASDFTGGSVHSLAYDEDLDVLFVGSLSAPHITAYRMGGSGFVSKYANPSTVVGTSVVEIAVQYEEAWKNTVI